MNTHNIELPPLPPGYTSYEFPDGGYDADEMRAYARAAVEADRQRRGEPVAWESTTPAYRKYVTDSTYQRFSDKSKCWYKPYRCASCDGAQTAEMEDPNTSPLSGKGPFKTASELIDSINEPVKVPSDAELLTCTGVSKHGDMPAIFGTADIRRFAECILKHFGQRPAEPDYKQLFEQMCERYNALDAKLAEYSEREPGYRAIEQAVPLTDERIRLIWKETLARMGDGGDPVLWFARAIERAHGISASQPTEPVKANDWLYDAMCATSHLDYESGAPHEVCQALRVLRAALNNEPYDAYLSVPLGPTQPAEPRLDAPAQVGPVRFGIGVKWSNVIRAAQRHHEYMRQPEQEQARMKKFGEAIKAIQPAEPVDKSENLQGNQVDKPAKTQGQTDEPVKVPSADAIADIVRDHLTAAYICNRVWEAWSYNTMGPDDFIEASETEMADEIAAAIVARYGQPAQPVVFTDANCEERFIEHESNACPYCGGSGHKDDVEPAVSAETVKVPSDLPVTEQEEEAWQRMEAKG